MFNFIQRILRNVKLRIHLYLPYTRGCIHIVYLITIMLTNTLTDFQANKSQKLCSWHFLSREIRLTQPLYKMQWICSNSFLKHGIYHQSFITKLGQTEYKQEEYICSFTKKALPKNNLHFTNHRVLCIYFMLALPRFIYYECSGIANNKEAIFFVCLEQKKQNVSEIYFLNLKTYYVSPAASASIKPNAKLIMAATHVRFAEFIKII